MNNNLEFENEDPCPDSIENNHPRTNYGEGYGGKEPLKEEFSLIDALKDVSNHLDKMNAIHEQQALLEEAAENYAKNIGNINGTAQWDFKKGAKWEREQSLPNIRNKLTPFQNLIAMLDNGLIHGTIQFHQLLAKEIEECKRSITYLTGDKIK